MLACTESNFSNFRFEYLRKKEFLRKIILACLLYQGPRWVRLKKKNRGRKSRDTAPLSRSKICSVDRNDGMPEDPNEGMPVDPNELMPEDSKERLLEDAHEGNA